MESYSPSQPLFGVTPMIVSESQNNDKAILVADDESPAPPDGPSNPPPYTSASSAGSPSGSAIRPVTQPRCNYLLDHWSNGNLKGTWHVDTSLPIPESLLPPIIDFDGRWNEETQKARKHKTPSISEVRPNLMVMTENGDVKADVYLMSGPAMVVAESKYGSVQLVVDAAPETVSRIHANASHGSVKVWIPSTFEGALTMGTTYGDIKISDGVRARMTTFYSKSNRSRSFIGDWQSAKFGTIQSEDGSKSSTPPDPFTSWPGSTIRIDSKNGTVSLAFIEEKPAANPASNEQNVFKTFFEGWFGKSVSTSEGTPSQAGTSQSQVGPSRDPVLEAALLDRKQLPPPPPGA